MKRLVAAAAGAATWSAAEWRIHNGLGHKFAKNRNFFAREHVRHHATTSYFAPSMKKAVTAAVVGSVMAPVSSALLGWRAGLSYTAGFLTAYGTYELLHRRAHTHQPTNRYGRWLRKHHFYHHFHNPAVNHGVTSPLWDHLFGSHEEPTVIRVPEKHAMPWLVDPRTGEVHERFRADYELIRKSRRTRPARTRGQAVPPNDSAPESTASAA